ncbi:MAG: hypothetical protein OXN88_14015, partial [Chloroflexota bacterium]|nr:hypothetical protein [Chloroflexota bacterium]
MNWSSRHFYFNRIRYTTLCRRPGQSQQNHFAPIATKIKENGGGQDRSVYARLYVAHEDSLNFAGDSQKRPYRFRRPCHIIAGGFTYNGTCSVEPLPSGQ